MEWRILLCFVWLLWLLLVVCLGAASPRRQYVTEAALSLLALDAHEVQEERSDDKEEREHG